LRRKVRGRARLTNHDRWFFIQLYRWFPSVLVVITIIRPETLVRWHRAGFCCYWRWKSRSLGGRPQIEVDLRELIRRMSIENPLWGATSNDAAEDEPDPSNDEQHREEIARGAVGDGAEVRRMIAGYPARPTSSVVAGVGFIQERTKGELRKPV
jgi:hypothetical protein